LKQFFRFGGGGRHKCFFAFLAKFTRLWAPTQCANFWLKFLLESRPSSESLKPLMHRMLLSVDNRPVARFQYLVGHNTYLGGQGFCFYSMFKTKFSGRSKIWGGTKQIWGECPPWLRTWWTTYPGTLWPFNSVLILLNLEKDLSPEQLVTIKLRNKAPRMGVRKMGKTGICLPWELGLRTKNF